MTDEERQPVAIRKACNHQVSHVEIVKGATPDKLDIEVVAARRDGVHTRLLSEVADEWYPHGGRIWLLRLSRESLTRFNDAKAARWLANQDGKDYGWWQALWNRAKPLVWRESFRELHCSELGAGFLQAGMVLPGAANCSRANPAHLVRLRLWSETYYELVRARELDAFNAVPRHCFVQHINQE